MNENAKEMLEQLTAPEDSPSLRSREPGGDLPITRPALMKTTAQKIQEGASLTTVSEKPLPRRGAFGITSESDPDVPSSSVHTVEPDEKDRRRIRFENPPKDEIEESEPVGEQERSVVRDSAAGKQNREFRMRFGLKRSKPQVEDTQLTENQDENRVETQPATPSEKADPKKTRFSFPRLGFNRLGSQKPIEDPAGEPKAANSADNVAEIEDRVEEIKDETPQPEAVTTTIVEEERKPTKTFGFLRHLRDTKAVTQDQETEGKSETQTNVEPPGNEPAAASRSNSWWKPRHSESEPDTKKRESVKKAVDPPSTVVAEEQSVVEDAVEQKSAEDAVQEASKAVDGSAHRFRFSRKLQRFSERTKSPGSQEPVVNPAMNPEPNGTSTNDQDSGAPKCLRLDVEPEEKAEDAIVNECNQDQDVFVSRLFIDRQFTQRRNAPPPSKQPVSAFVQRSLAPKPGATSEIYDSCLSKLGRICQGLLGGLCLFFLILLLTAESSLLKGLFTNNGGQGQILQMLIYLLVIVSVITSFEGMNYQQIMAERRLNRFCITSVIYPAMLILGLTVMKLDNSLALESGFGEDDWQEWRTVNLVRCCLGITAWMILCA